MGQRKHNLRKHHTSGFEENQPGILIPDDVSATMLREWAESGVAFTIERRQSWAIIRRDGIDWMTLPIF